MVNWKVALIAIVIAILLIVAGMWFGYRYVSEQDDIPVGWQRSPDIIVLCSDTPLRFCAPYLPTPSG